MVICRVPWDDLNDVSLALNMMTAQVHEDWNHGGRSYHYGRVCFFYSALKINVRRYKMHIPPHFLRQSIKSPVQRQHFSTMCWQKTQRVQTEA